MKKVITIMCACGTGLASSAIIQMNIERTLQEDKIENTHVFHQSWQNIHPELADIFVVGKDLSSKIHGYPRVIVLQNILSYEEVSSKIKQAFSMSDGTYWIE